MRWLFQMLARLVVTDDGATTVEYAMMLLLIFLAVLTGITALGQATAQGMAHPSSSCPMGVARP